MHCALPIAVIALILIACACARPAVVYTPTGIYADPSDDTVQCLDAYRVCIGNEYGARNAADLALQGVSHIVTAIGMPDEPLAGIVYHSALYEDSPHTNPVAHWDAAADFIDGALSVTPTNRVLVHCAAGMSRSASTLIYYLIKRHTLSYQAAHDAVKAARDIIRPNAGFEERLRAFAANNCARWPDRKRYVRLQCNERSEDGQLPEFVAENYRHEL
jgi:atypical dual specificity phosphatase